MIKLDIIEAGIMDVSEIDRLKEFPKEYGVQRMLDRGNVNRIKNSMESLYVPSIIKVNQDWYILDGQHSKQAIKELAIKGAEFAYVMYNTNGLDKEICVKLNTTSKQWNANDFLELWINTGNEHYIWYKNVMDKYNLSIQATTFLVTGKVHVKSTQSTSEFNSGDMIITPKQRAKVIYIADRLQEIRNILPKNIANDRSFHIAFMKVFNSGKYDHQRMLDKLKNQRDRDYKCNSQSGYIDMIENIYNYKTRNKVYFNDK